jgi:hypothetical protein
MLNNLLKSYNIYLDHDSTLGLIGPFLIAIEEASI